MFYIEQKYGNDGYASWIKILRQLSVTNHHYLNLSDKVEFMYLSSKCRVSEDTLRSIIQDLCDLGEFNNELWFEYNIIFSEKLVESVKDAYLKRNNKCITLVSLLQLLKGLGIRKLSNVDIKVGTNTQSRVEYSKVEESKVDIITPPKGEAIDFDKFIKTFNSFANRNFRATDKVKNALKARLKNYTRAEILKAIESAHKDKFHVENNFKDLTPEFILREDKLEKFLNKQPAIVNGTYIPLSNKIDHSNRED